RRAVVVVRTERSGVHQDGARGGPVAQIEHGRFDRAITGRPAVSNAAAVDADHQLAAGRVDHRPLVRKPCPRAIIIELDQVAIDEVGSCPDWQAGCQCQGGGDQNNGALSNERSLTIGETSTSLPDYTSFHKSKALGLNWNWRLPLR